MTERIYFDFRELEEFHSGMWRIVRGSDRAKNALAAARLMRDSVAFKAAMMRALDEWPKSCEHNLTADGVNKLAWLGHAGNCIEHGGPEENTRIGWHQLAKEEQDEANRVAQEVLEEWHRRKGLASRDLFSC